MISEKAATALATVATVCWCVQLIPQIIYNWKKKDCTGLPPLMMFLWVVSGIPFAIYFCVSKGNVILQVQPHLFMFFCSISFIQSCYYPPVSMARSKIVLIIATIIAVDVGMEVGFILWLRPLYGKGVKWPDLIFGVSASVLLAVGLLPPYFELAKRKGRVVGINFAFLSIDSLGAWLSIISVILGNMDIMGIILYSIVAGMELGIFASHFIWWCRFRLLTKDKIVDEENDGTQKEEQDEKLEQEIGKNDHNVTSTNMDDHSIRDDASSFADDLNVYQSADGGILSRTQTLHAVHGVVARAESDHYSRLSL
ncbi:hypothetical protein SKDZ_04G3150 [Saccharomyces kudriavzevii ZP591]|uniref:YDR090C-like protein n=1 Tax=Saccharomyces cerevisiae x Saccharomyces kudriavzevii (strain VIN7) TaxID=1095631 RepID=H0GSP7_SACCK|nr:YDR090C-like protein [Saccharomyces cerevisiae x Saccharomyces kudriavzevii VIN7]CAI4058108.1 hypothetical protein SKDZ_04G3150 [Saccharomyces kudriavzevii ZP591]